VNTARMWPIGWGLLGLLKTCTSPTVVNMIDPRESTMHRRFQSKEMITMDSGLASNIVSYCEYQ
jgi:hypothetical protein